MLLAGVIRWAGLSAFAILLGALALDFFILPRDPALGPARRRLGGWSDAAAAALLVASAGELILRASVMAGEGRGPQQRRRFLPCSRTRISARSGSSARWR